MEQEIKDVIAKHLPQHVGDVLKTRLAKADDDQYQLKLAKEANELLSEELAAFKKKYEEQKELGYRKQMLDNLEKELTKREQALDLTIAKLKLEESEKRSDAMFNMVQTVFRSPVYRKHIDNNMFYSYDQSGRQIVTGGVPTNVTESND